MAYPVFTPPGIVGISPGSTKATKPRVLRNNFGDGYSQRAGDGLNQINRKLDIELSALASSEADTIEAFFEERAGYQPFLWTPPGEATARKWIAPEWQRTYNGTGTVDVAVTFEEVFDPES